jgi:hypothetical protein
VSSIGMASQAFCGSGFSRERLEPRIRHPVIANASEVDARVVMQARGCTAATNVSTLDNDLQSPCSIFAFRDHATETRT